MRQRRYTLVVSVFSKLHQRSSPSYGSRATTEHHALSSLRSPQYVPSVTRYTGLGLWTFLGGTYWSRSVFRVRLSLPRASASSRIVCLPKAYSLQSSFSRVLFLLSLLSKKL